MTKEPVKLTFYYMFSDGGFDAFMKGHGSYMQQKYPNLSFQYILNAKGSILDDMVASNANIDVFITNASAFSKIADLGLAADISGLVRTYGYDLNQLEPSAVEALRKAGGGKLSGLPFDTIRWFCTTTRICSTSSRSLIPRTA
jgi:ABC-type glycerol-3-phosphate transport system substrate-binding protein